MNKFTKKDLLFSVVTGLYAGVIGWQILDFLHISIFQKVAGILSLNIELSNIWIVAIIPIVWIVGVNFGYFLGRWVPVFNQFGRFAAVGFTNFFVYSGILNLLIAFTGQNSGIWYSVFVSASFVAGVLHSFALNKNWVFESGQSAGGAEFGKFITVAILSGLVNVAVASVIVNFIDPMFGIDANGWANVGGIAGSAVALIFSFVGFKLLVFKKVPLSDAVPQI